MSRRRMFGLVLAGVLLVSGLVVPAGVGAQSNASADPSHEKTVLFLCPHGAAKSVLASAYFQKVARERGLKVRVEAAGTEPQEAVSPVVAEHLRKQGLPLPVAKPAAVTPRALETADVVVSMGCDVSRLPVRPGTLRRWDEVPAPRENLKGADDAIQARVAALVEELIAQRERSR